MHAAGAAPPGRVAEWEDAAILGHKPVAEGVAGVVDGDDRLVEVHSPGAAESGGAAEGEDAAVAGDQPVSGRVEDQGRHRRLGHLDPAHEHAHRLGVVTAGRVGVGRPNAEARAAPAGAEDRHEGDALVTEVDGRGDL